MPLSRSACLASALLLGAAPALAQVAPTSGPPTTPAPTTVESTTPATTTRSDDAGSAARLDAAAAPQQAPLDVRLTLTSFLYRERGAAAPALVDQGAALDNASPVRRAFGDLRVEAELEGLTVDARVRQTGAQRFQSGATGASEYELRALNYRLGGARTWLTVGRQVVEAAGALRLDGAVLTRALPADLELALFAGAAPALGSRSLDTDYQRARAPDGREGDQLVPLAAGAALTRRGPAFHGELGVAAEVLARDPGNGAARSRALAASSGYWRAAAPVDLFHLAQLDLAGAGAPALANATLGLGVQLGPALRLTALTSHQSSRLLQLGVRDQLADPDPSAMGFVENRLLTARVSQDQVRAGLSLALARQRFEVSLSGAARRRPALEVPLADGVGALTFPENRSAEATITVLDRRSLAGLRLAASATAITPLGDSPGNRASATLVRVSASRTFSKERGQLELDAAVERLRDRAADPTCMTSLAPLDCYGRSRTTAAQGGALMTWRASREWLLVADAHAGTQAVSSVTLAGTTEWPRVLSLTAFLRLQWRYR